MKNCNTNSISCDDQLEIEKWSVFCNFYCRLCCSYYIKNIKQTEQILPDNMVDDIIRESQLQFLHLNCLEVATQLTLRDFQLFRDIRPTEYVIDLFKLSPPDGPSQTTNLESFTNVSYLWTITLFCTNVLLYYGLRVYLLIPVEIDAVRWQPEHIDDAPLKILLLLIVNLRFTLKADINSFPKDVTQDKVFKKYRLYWSCMRTLKLVLNGASTNRIAM